jgi:hypothetical protein
MERFVRSRHGAAHLGNALAAIILVAVFVFGAPPWILVPVTMAGMSLFTRLRFPPERPAGRK